ncbi:hypothetical protein RJ641_014232 [Dillenia turbinata]|uniref:Myb-like domain-containing protein n=1 Tax=Dillenia turbinata TaxID=194707 RepID=A0AAN8UWS2_9MAGN
MNTSDDEVSGCVDSDDIVGAYKDGGKSGNEKSIESESEGRKKKKKKKGEKEKTDYAHEVSLDIGDEIDLVGIKRKRKKYECGVVEEDSKVEKRRKAKTVKDGREENFHKGKKRGKETVEMDNVSENPKPKQKSKRVTFSTHVEVFPSSTGFEMEKQKEGLEQHSTSLTSEIEEQKEGLEQHSAEEQVGRERVYRGSFSEEEDAIIKEAVEKYVKEHDLGENLADENPQLRGCWKEIGAALPHRPWVSIYKRAHNLYERDDKREWTTEEYELIQRYHEEHGSDWKTLADALGKHRVHLKDVWRRIKLRNEKRGYWSQDEYQKLFDLATRKGKARIALTGQSLAPYSETSKDKEATDRAFQFYLGWPKMVSVKEELKAVNLVKH